MTPVNDDIAAIEKALAEQPERHEYPLGVSGSLDYARDFRAWLEDISEACTPARLRRVLDTMAQMASALDGLLNDPGDDHIRASKWDAARAALALYRGTK